MIGTRLAHFEIVSLLGKGGMGEVYRATDKKLATSPYREFAVAPDGSYFVFPRDSGDQSDAHSFTVVENWFEAFRED